MRWIGTTIGALAIFIATAGTALGDEAGEAAQEYRHSLYESIVWNFRPMSEMVRGKRPYDAVEVKRRALSVAYLSLLLDEAFPPGSGASAGTTDALDDIWKTPEDFAAKLKAFQNEANTLRVVAQKGDEASFTEQFKKVGGACKDCHDKYKAD